MTQIELKPCKVHWCEPRLPKHEYGLKLISGICLEEVGVPDKGRAVINRTIKPRVGDLVHCNDEYCTISGFIKQVKSFDGEEMVVGTRYLDHSKNFDFYCFEFYGVVEMIFDMTGNIVYRRADNERNDM
jgi:hypothetical protein